MSTLILRQQLVRKSLIHKIQVTLESVQGWMDRHHQRKQLAKLDLKQLEDMGITIEQLQSELAKPFWR